MGQFADDKMTPSPLNVSRDKFENEIPTDKPMHGNSTDGEGAFHWDGNQYDDGPSKGGSKSYGQSVEAPTGVERNTVDVSRADRGKES
jgi:hypothetical protein